MPREFHIRIEGKQDDLVDCLVYDNLAEANSVYTVMLLNDTEGETYQLELVEVLRQDTICCGEKVDGQRLYRTEGGDHAM